MEPEKKEKEKEKQEEPNVIHINKEYTDDENDTKESNHSEHDLIFISEKKPNDYSSWFWGLGLLAFLVFVGFGYSQGWFSQIINPKEQNNQSVIENTVKSIVEVPKNPAPIESVQIETLESFPVQKILVLKGVFSDGCGFLEDPVQSLDGNLFSITLETRLVDPNTNCTQALVPFERKIDLMVNNLPGGTYNVRVNGQYEIQFILAEDNRIDFDAGESK